MSSALPTSVMVVFDPAKAPGALQSLRDLATDLRVKFMSAVAEFPNVRSRFVASSPLEAAQFYDAALRLTRGSVPRSL